MIDVRKIGCGPGPIIERAIGLHMHTFRCLPLRIEMHPNVMFDLAMNSTSEKYTSGEVCDYYCGVRIVENMRIDMPAIVSVNNIVYLV